ncbi:MAG: CoA-binding protein [Clostridiales bacterium]|nr:CoA-binding protein [Clostridiales bacterium]
MSSIHSMFHARSVAVVGASRTPGKTGNTILRNLIDGGYQGAIYPINPQGGVLMGKPCYASLDDISEDIDLIVVAIPARFVPGILEQAGRRHAKGAIIISGGFRETGNDALEADTLDVARRCGIRLIGPNCQGLNYTPNHLCASWPLVSACGTIAIVSQSGTIGAAMEIWAEQDHLGLSAFVALGNKSDISEEELMMYFADDPNTSVLALNVEGVKNGRSFIDCVRYCAERKPLIILKPGRSKRGQVAAQSHTKSIGGRDQVFEAVCRQFGALRAYDLSEFYDYAKIASLVKKPAGNRLAIVTSSGGSGILAVDAAVENGIDIAPLEERAAQKLRAALPEQCVIANPLDLTGDADAERFRLSLAVLLEQEGIDTVLAIFGDPIPGASEVLRDLAAHTTKRIIAAYLGGGEVEKTEVSALHECGIPVFPTPERAAKALGGLLRLGK